MKLDLDRTPGGRSSLQVAGSFELDQGPGGPGIVQVAGDLCVDNLESRCVLRGELAALGPVLCDRCLQEFVFGFPVPVQLLVLRDGGSEEADSETMVLHQRDGIVDLHECVREAVVLAVPLSRFCREDCRGLCSHCGADLNEGPCGCRDDEPDPRWDGLPG